jgi:hypothetical protein
MQEELFTEAAKARHGQLIHEAETFRRALQSRKVKASSPLLKGLLIFLIAVA